MQRWHRSDLIMIYESDSGHAQPMAAIRSVRSVDKDKNVIFEGGVLECVPGSPVPVIQQQVLEPGGDEDHYRQDVPRVHQ